MCCDNAQSSFNVCYMSLKIYAVKCFYVYVIKNKRIKVGNKNGSITLAD